MNKEMIPVEYPSILHAIPASSLISKTSHRKSRKYMKFNIKLRALISMFDLSNTLRLNQIFKELFWLKNMHCC